MYDYETAWERVWSVVAPKLPTRGLERLRQALAEDSDTLIGGATTDPPPLVMFTDFPCRGACVAGYPFAFGGEAPLTVAQAEEKFAALAQEVDGECGETGAMRYLTNWWDEGDRTRNRAALLPLVDAELQRREGLL